MKKFCEFLGEHAKNIIDFEKKKMLMVTKEELTSHQNAKLCKKLCKNISYQKFRDHYHYTGKYRDAEHSICNLRFNAPHEILAVFHNSSNYDYHCIINELAKKFEGKFKCPDENTGKYKRFAVPIAKEVIKIGKDVRVL